MFPCQQCGTPRFLYRGLCKTCAPDLHFDYETEKAYWDTQFADFQREHGQSPLQEWSLFEFWYDTRQSLASDSR